MTFRVDLDMFRGPLDLLHYLVRKHELDVTQVPLAVITEQFLDYLEVLQQLDVDAAGDFIEIASLLIEAKSRQTLPRPEEQQPAVVEQAIEEPEDELVQRLLEYKQYKDAATTLSEGSHHWQQHYPRVANDLPPRNISPAEQPIHEVELWDLVSAMGRIMRASKQQQPATNIVYDDTPVEVFMQTLHQRIIGDDQVSFTSMFQPGMRKTQLIGVFLAILELVRNYGVVVEQQGIHGEMWMRRGPQFKPELQPNAESSFTTIVEDDEASAGPAKPR